MAEKAKNGGDKGKMRGRLRLNTIGRYEPKILCMFVVECYLYAMAAM